MSKGKVLVVEPDEESHASLRSLLEALPYEYQILRDARTAMAATAAFAPNLVILANSRFVHQKKSELDVTNQHLIEFFKSLKVAVGLMMPLSPDKSIKAETIFLWNFENISASIMKPLSRNNFSHVINDGFRLWLSWEVPEIERGALLIVEADEEFRRFLELGLSHKGYYPIFAVENDEEAIELCQEETIGIIISELNSAGNIINNKYIKSRQLAGEDLSVIVFSEQRISNMFSPFDAEILKPIDFEELHLHIRNCFEVRQNRKVQNAFYTWQKEQTK